MAEPTRIETTTLAPLISASIVFAAGVLTLALVNAGPLSIQMAQHLFVMNVAAPVVAIVLTRTWSGRLKAARGLFWFAGSVQIALLWAWHAPPLQRAAAESASLHVGLLALLAIAAIVFWTLLVRAGTDGSWRAIVALLLTGKLACLLGALLIFAPTELYGLQGLAICSTGPSTIEDQHLAGLLMITACPLSYLVAGVILAAQMIGVAPAPYAKHRATSG